MIKLRTAVILGLAFGVALLVAFPGVGEKADDPPVELYDVDGAEPGDEPEPPEPPVADATEVGHGHWINTWRSCMVEPYELWGPRSFCSDMIVGGRYYHVVHYDRIDNVIWVQ